MIGKRIHYNWRQLTFTELDETVGVFSRGRELSLISFSMRICRVNYNSIFTLKYHMLMS